PRRLRLRPVRRELHRRGAARRRGLHRRPLSDRRLAVLGLGAAGDALSRWLPPGRPAAPVAVRLPPAARRLLHSALGGGGSGAGDATELAERGPEAMSIPKIDGLPYLPGHARRDLERALRIPALPPGWQGSFREMLEADEPAAPAWAGLRPLRVKAIERE